MNLSLHDPFTLAQDSPESLVNELSTFYRYGLADIRDGKAEIEAKNYRIWSCHNIAFQSQG